MEGTPPRGRLRTRLPGGALGRLLAAWLALSTGTWALVVALSVHAFDAFGPGAVGVVLAARLVPAALAAPFTAHLADRHDRARLVAFASGIQAVAFGGAAALVLTDAPLVALLALVAVGGGAGTAQRPAMEALMPALASTPDELTRATATWSALDNAGFLIGGGVGGMAIAAVGAGQVIGVAAVLIALGAVVSMALPHVTATEPDEPMPPETLRSELLGGIRVLRETPALRTPLVLFSLLLLLEGITEVLIVVLAIGDLGMGNGGPGLLYTVWGVAGLLGSGLVLVLLRRRGYGLVLSVGVLAHAGGLAVMGLDGVPLAIAAVVPTGAGYALVDTATLALAPRLADDATLGRVYGLMELMYAGLVGLGALLGPLLAAWLGAAGGLAASGSGYVLAGLLTWRALAELDSGQEEAGRVRELLRGIPFLTGMPLPRLERLVRGTRPLTARPGEEIISRGDPGEDFYVIEEGTVEVPEYGRLQGPGTGFGEIALLHDVPRTATVRATGEVRLRVLGRRAFLAAVTGHEDAHASALAIAAEHLARAR